jgi:WD40 repeat protein
MITVKKISELTGHSGAVYALERSETANCFYSGSSDKIVAKWNLDTLAPEKFAAQLPGIIYSLCFIPEKNILLAGTSEGKIHVLDLKEKKETKILQNHIQPVFDIKYSPRNKIILSAGGDGILAAVSGETLTAIKILKLCNDKLRAIDIYEDQAAIACGDGMIRIIDLKELKVKNETPAHEGSVYTVKFSPDGKHLLSGGKDAHLNKWTFEPETFNLKLETSIPAHNFAIYSIVFSPAGKYFATASRDKTIKIWNANTFEVLTRVNKENFEGHTHSVNKLFWNKYLISASDDRKVMVWDLMAE